MPPMQFKFKFAKDDDVHIASYQDNPSWDDLASRVSRIYKIPTTDVGISYNDSEGDEITISSDEELRDYYTTLPQIQHHSLKFIVKDLRPKRPPRPATDIFASLDEAWTPPLFSTVPLTPSRLYQQGGTGAHIEELDEVDEQKSNNRARNYDDDDDLKSYLDIPGQQQEPEDADDASSIDSVLDDDLPDKKPIHVYRFSTSESRRAHSAASLSRSSTRSKSVAESVDQTRQNLEAQFDIVTSEQFKMQSPKPSEFDIVDDAFPAAGNHLPDPTDSHTRNRSRSRSPLLHPHTIPSREPSVDRYSARSSRVASEYPSPIVVIPTIDTASPRGAPASVDIYSIPSPDPIVISVPSIPEESMLLQETSAMTITEPDPPLPTLPPFSFSSATTATTTTTPSLTNDIATLLDALIGAFNEHPELSEGLRNIVSNASQGVYWNNATEAIRSIRDTVVSDALQARNVIRTESATAARDVSSQVQAEAGRRIAEALGNVFRSLGTVLGANSTEAAPVSAAPSVPQSQAKRQQHQVHSSRRSQTSLGAPRAESPLLIKATPLIHNQDIPPDARSLSRPSSRSSSSERDNNLYPGGSTVRVSRRGEKYGYAPPQFIPVVWASPPPRAPRDGRGPYGPPPPPPVVIPTPMHSHGYGRSRHHRSQSGTTGSGARYPPPAGPPPPGAYYMPPYPPSPYSYRPDPRMYMDQYYNRNGYPGIGAGANMRRSNTLPPSFPANAEQPPPTSEAARPIITAPEIPRPVQPSSPSASLANARNAPAESTVIAARSPTPSFGASPSIAATTTEILGSSAALVTTSGTLQKSLDDTYIELEEVKRLYKEKKEDYRREREERKIQKERERAQRHAEREAKRQARLAAVARVRGEPIPTPQPAAPVATLKQPTPGDVSGSESGTEKALPIPFEQGVTGLLTSTPPRRANSSTERLNKEVHDRLNAMGFTTRSYPQLNTLVPMNIRKHVMLLPDVPDEVIIHNVLEDIFAAPTLPTSSSNKI